MGGIINVITCYLGCQVGFMDDQYLKGNRPLGDWYLEVVPAGELTGRYVKLTSLFKK